MTVRVINQMGAGAAAQIAAALLGVMIAHMVTGMVLVQVATQAETGAGVWIGSTAATGTGGATNCGSGALTLGCGAGAA